MGILAGTWMTIGPVLSIDAPLAAQLTRLEHEAGVREQL